MGPVEGVLVWMVGAAALVGAGYLLGRIWPGPRNLALVRHDADRESQRHFKLKASPAGRAAPPARTPRPPGQRAMDERLRREIEHVHALRRARENAEPWLPPAVDSVGAAAARVWFADTAVEPYTPGPKR